MDFTWTDSEKTFRKELSDYLDAALPPNFDSFAMPEEEWATFSKKFCSSLAEHGYLTPSWPREYGGRAASAFEQVIVAEEMIRRGEPRGLQYMSVNFIGPAIMSEGTAEQKAHHLRLISRGEILWCQGFSEPDAGSDLPSLRTRAVLDGDIFIINGEKIWTSGARFADYCFLLCRTEAGSTGPEGLSLLLVPMTSDGIEVRPIRTIVGDEAFNQVHFSDVKVPADALLGALNDGWRIVRRALAHERVGVARYIRAGNYLERFIRYASERSLLADPVVQRLAACSASGIDSTRILAMKIVSDRAFGTVEPAYASLYRISTIQAERALMEFGFELLGVDGLVDGSSYDRQFRWGMTSGVAGGTLEMQLNTVARAVLNSSGRKALSRSTP